MENTTYPIGPIWQAVLKSIWTQLFTTGSTIYLPTIIKNGNKSLGLPSYDPAEFTGHSQNFAISNVPSGVISSACVDPSSPTPPTGSDPSLALGDVKMVNLSVMTPGAMTFAADEPTVTIEVTVGNETTPFILTKVDDTSPNFFFEVSCCTPDPDQKGKCTKNWITKASGQFDAQVTGYSIQITAQLNTPENEPPNIQILTVTLDVTPEHIDLNFDVKDLPAWAQGLAKIAVQQGVNDNAIPNVIQAFLNQDSVKGDMEKLINEQLKKIWKQTLLIY